MEWVWHVNWALLLIVAALVAWPKRWVSIYMIDRAWGGPEEGGWWYDYGLLESDHSRCCFKGFTIRAEAKFQAICDEYNDGRRTDISSMASEGKYVVSVEDHPPHDWPDTWPHYE